MTPHEAKYNALANALGRERLRGLIPFTPEQVQAAIDSGDEHLNTLPLHKWDRMHPTVFMMAREAQEITSWSLDDTVCTLKHLARQRGNSNNEVLERLTEEREGEV